MKWSNLTCVISSLGLLCGGVAGCTPTEAPTPTVTVQPVKLAQEDAHAEQGRREDVEADAGDDEEEEEEKEPTAGKPDAAKAKADAGIRDAGADGGKMHRAAKRPDAGDGGDAGDGCDSYVEVENSSVDLAECEQFQSEDCASRADEVCQAFHAFRDHQVFAAFVSCVADTPGLDLCAEDQSAVAECEVEAKANACRTHQVACEAYEGCETISVDDCDTLVASISANTVDMFGDVYHCELSPTYFLE